MLPEKSQTLLSTSVSLGKTIIFFALIFSFFISKSAVDKALSSGDTNNKSYSIGFLLWCPLSGDLNF